MPTITSTEAGASGRYINLGSPASQDNIGAQTWIAYVKPETFTASSSYMFAKGGASILGIRGFMLTDASRILAIGSDSTGTAFQPSQNTASSAYTKSVWEHFTFTWDGSLTGANMIIYRGATNVSSSSSNGTTAISADASYDLFLMNRQGTDREFMGDIAYVARWDRVLTSGERATVIADGPLEVPSGLILLWANDQDYSTNAIVPSARSTRVTGSTPTNTALGGAPALTSPTGAQTGSTTASGGVTTDEANGTLYAVCTTSGTAPTKAQVKLGQDNSSVAATYASNAAITTTGAKTVAATGLTASTTYYWHFMHEDAATNQSTVSSSTSFTTAASGGASAVAKIIQQMRN